jgi:Na+/H+-dicarboxylate symporter
LVIALSLVKALNFPLEVAAIISSIFRLINMGITTVNGMEDRTGTVAVAYSEKDC